jgi:hypothetical protein
MGIDARSIFVLTARLVGALLAIGAGLILGLVAVSIVNPQSAAILSSESMGVRVLCLVFAVAVFILGLMIARTRKL